MAIKILPRLLLAALFCLFPLVVQADPIQLTSGGFSSGGVHNFKSVSANGAFPGLTFMGSTIIDLCGAGCPPSPSDGFSTLLSDHGGSGQVVYQGTTYRYFGIHWSFGESSISGSLSIFLNGNRFPNNSVLFSFEFFGLGIGTATVLPDGRTSHAFVVTPPTQTPEPATLLLLASGLPLLLIRRR